MITDKFLLDVIRCPACHGEFDVREDSLTCRDCGRTYPVQDGIPVLLLDEATGGPAAESQEIAQSPQTAESPGDGAQ